MAPHRHPERSAAESKDLTLMKDHTLNGQILRSAQNDDGAEQQKSQFRLPFAARFQGILIVVMLVGLVLIGQQIDKRIYQIGLPLLVLAAFLQIAFGNIPPRSNFKQSMLLLLLTWVIVGAVFVAGILLAPTLIDMSR